MRDGDQAVQGSFFHGMTDVADGVRTMDQILADIERVWVELEAAEG